MTRTIICKACHAKQKPMHPEDVAMGFQRRTVQGLAKKPEVHGITILKGGKEVSREELTTLQCDHCGLAIPDGSPIAAVTMWRTEREGEPLAWENDFFQPA